MRSPKTTAPNWPALSKNWRSSLSRHILRKPEAGPNVSMAPFKAGCLKNSACAASKPKNKPIVSSAVNICECITSHSNAKLGKKVPPSTDLDKVFCFKHDRTVNKDNTVSFNHRLLQISPSHLRFSFAKCKVTVFEHLDRSISIGFGPHTLGYYSPDGMPLNPRKIMTKNKIRKIPLTV